MIFDELKRFDIVFDSPETPLSSPPVFSGGDAVSGRVVVELSAASSLQSIKLQAKGVAKVRFTDWYLPSEEEDYTKEYSDEEEYLIRREVFLLRSDNGKPTTLPAGRHEFAFSFQLPEDALVTSFQGKHGSIRYWVKVRIQRPWASGVVIKKEFTFIEHINVNTPTLLTSQSVTKENNVTVWLRNIGHLSITAQILRKGYTPGEVVHVFAEFHNATSRSAVPKAYITQTQTFVTTSEGTTKTECSVVAMLCGAEVGAQCREMWVGRPLRIPMVEPSILQCPIIKVEYMLRVFVEIRGTSKLCVELPLVMGTIPLCQSGEDRMSAVFRPYQEWLHVAFPEHPEPPPEYSSVVTEEEAGQYTSSSPPAYCETSQSVTKENNVTVWLRNIGHLSITAQILRKGYTPGEVVHVFAEFHNATSRSAVPKAYITQTQTFVTTSEGTTKTECSVVAMLCGAEVGAQCREMWVGRPLRIPMVEPSILQCPIIKVEYMLRVFVEIRGTSKLCVELPLVMGTIPLCQSGEDRMSAVFRPYQEWLHVAFPEHPEPPPEYSSVVTEEEAGQYTSSSPPAYCETSQSVTKENNVTVWLRNIGHLSITAQILRKGYTPGEVVHVFAEFHNATSRSAVPKAYITQTQTFVTTSEGTTKTECSVVAMLCGAEVGAQCREMWVGRPLRIPMVEPSILQCPIIKVEYMLRVFVEIRGTSKLCVELPLVMGTIPLCQSGEDRMSAVFRPYQEWLHVAFPEHPEPPPEYSSVVTEEEAGQYTSSSPPAYCEVDPYPQPLS